MKQGRKLGCATVVIFIAVNRNVQIHVIFYTIKAIVYIKRSSVHVIQKSSFSLGIIAFIHITSAIRTFGVLPGFYQLNFVA